MVWSELKPLPSDIKIYVDPKGYEYFYAGKDHPLSSKGVSSKGNGCVFVHRHNASVKIGRWLTTEEHIHHVDENKRNNDGDNLLIVNSSEHTKLHRTKYNRLILKCEYCTEFFECSENKGYKRHENHFCSMRCSSNYARKFHISKEDLEALIKEKPYEEIGRMFGVSGNAIKKRAKRLGIELEYRRGKWGFMKL